MHEHAAPAGVWAEVEFFFDWVCEGEGVAVVCGCCCLGGEAFAEEVWPDLMCKEGVEGAVGCFGLGVRGFGLGFEEEGFFESWGGGY